MARVMDEKCVSSGKGRRMMAGKLLYLRLYISDVLKGASTNMETKDD